MRVPARPTAGAPQELPPATRTMPQDAATDAMMRPLPATPPGPDASHAAVPEPAAALPCADTSLPAPATAYPPPAFAALDLGTNNCRLLVGDARGRRLPRGGQLQPHRPARRGAARPPAGCRRRHGPRDRGAARLRRQARPPAGARLAGRRDRGLPARRQRRRLPRPRRGRDRAPACASSRRGRRPSWPWNPARPCSRQGDRRALLFDIGGGSHRDRLGPRRAARRAQRAPRVQLIGYRLPPARRGDAGRARGAVLLHRGRLRRRWWTRSPSSLARLRRGAPHRAGDPRRRRAADGHLRHRHHAGRRGAGPAALPPAAGRWPDAGRRASPTRRWATCSRWGGTGWRRIPASGRSGWNSCCRAAPSMPRSAGSGRCRASPSPTAACGRACCCGMMRADRGGRHWYGGSARAGLRSASKTKGPPPGSGRGLSTRLRTAKGRTPRSQRWLERQLNDPYVQAAKAQGWRSRAAFKLLELDERFKLSEARRAGGGPRRRAGRLDAGGAAGGGAAGEVVALDLLPMDPVPGAVVLQGDFQDEAAEQRGAGGARRPGRPGAVGHGAEHHRACHDRPPAHHGAGRARAGFRAEGAGAGRRLRREGVPGRQRSARCWTR